MTSEVLHYSQLLCESITRDYKNYTMKSFQYNLSRASEPQSFILSRDKSYWNKCLEQIREGTYDYRFNVRIDEGRKYLKLVQVSYNREYIHCFIDKTNGDVYKPASFNSPIKDVRYNLLNAESRDNCYRNVDWSGSYLDRK